MLGQLESIRAYAALAHKSGRDEPLAPQYDFFAGRADRASCFASDAVDGGLPIGARGLELNVTGPHPLICEELRCARPRSHDPRTASY